MAGQDRSTPDGVKGAASKSDELSSLMEKSGESSRDHEIDHHKRARAQAEGDLLDLLRRVGETPWEFDFFELMRRVEALAAVAQGAPGLGRSSRSREDPVRFGQDPSLAFAPRAISSAKTRAGITRVAVNFMGLLGPQGPMPLHFADYVRSRELHHQDPTWARFLDVFNNRMVALLYRAWAMNRPMVSRDATANGQVDRDRFAAYVGSFFGLGTPSVWNRDAVADDAKRFFAGRLANQTRSPEALASILREFFGAPVEIEEFVGRWSELPEQYLTRLGRKGVSTIACGSGGRAAGTAILGGRVWECQSTVRITIGPLPWKAYEQILPGSKGYEQLVSWISMFGGIELGWEVVLVLDRREVPLPRLGGGGGVRLGYSAWMSRTKPEQDPADVVLRSR
jgi:type VI secretion system protein ImpH